jgi:hypothetical protein
MNALQAVPHIKGGRAASARRDQEMATNARIVQASGMTASN